MRRKLLAFVMIFGFCTVTTVPAQEQKGSALSDWLKSIQKKMEKILPKKEIATSTGVAGVRGAKQDSQSKLYWKGRKGETAVTEEELGMFRSGVDLAAKGDRAGAVKELEAFMKQYPDSTLIPDAKKTLDLVKAAPPEAKEEKKAPEEMKKEDQKKEDQKEDKQDLKDAKKEVTKKSD